MSGQQGSHASGQRPAAKPEFRRRLTCRGKLSDVMAAEANAGSDRHSSLGKTHTIMEEAL
jgi:hypothetical protein